MDCTSDVTMIEWTVRLLNERFFLELTPLEQSMHSINGIRVKHVSTVIR